MVKVIYWILALLVGGFGFFCIRDPEDAIYLANFWRFDNFDPSDGYIRLTRVAGVVYILVAIILIVASFTQF